MNHNVNANSKHPVENKPRNRVSPVSSRWFRISLVTLVLSLGILLGTPLLIERLAEQWLERNGGDQV